MPSQEWIFMKEDQPFIGENGVAYLFFIVCSLLNVYAMAKLLNLFRSLWGTKLFTIKPMRGGLVVKGKEPMVTIQICAYNEEHVVNATIDAACQVDWPRHKLTVQLLDDSTDSTSQVIEKAAAAWRHRGINCRRLTRPNRMGYKAGALYHNTKNIRGDFVVLLDSDHRCHPKFLRRTVPHFFNQDGTHNAKVGLVQAPWAYYNTHQNLLTEQDAMGLDISHVMEQVGRYHAFKCFGFNGTGGIWRVAAIEAAGGWQWDTVTEDLDLSYLAYSNGYEFVYLRDIPQELELPSGILAHNQQKHRWTKGYFQVLRKSFWNILRSPHFPLSLKIEFFFQTTVAVTYPLFVITTLLYPFLLSVGATTPFLIMYSFIPLVVTPITGITTVYAKTSTGTKNDYTTFWSRTARLVYVPIFMVVVMGRSLYETYAMMDGIFSDDATFLRTPKEGSTIPEISGRISPVDVRDIELAENGIAVGAMDTKAADLKQGSTLAFTSRRRKLRSSLFTIDNFVLVLGFAMSFYLVGVVGVILKSSPSMSWLSMASTLRPLVPAVGFAFVHGSVLKEELNRKMRKQNKMT